MNVIKVILYCTIYAILNVSGAAIVKLGLAQKPVNSLKDYLPFLLNFKIIFAFILIFISALVMFKALSEGKFTIVVPLASGINFAFTVIAGYYLFKDNLSIVHFIGLCLIIAGILILGLAER
jgi:multidrug transporter EmrE-like cation transporter